MRSLRKKLLWGVLVISASTTVVLADILPPPPPIPAGSTNALGPRIQFETPTYDFGRVKSGEPVKHDFIFTNIGDALLIIKGVNPGCGCTTVGQWTKEVEPGKTGSVSIQFNTHGYNSAVIKQPSITCNITNQPVVVMTLKGTVYKPYDINPQLAVLNVPPDSEKASIVVTITNNTDEPLMLAAPESNNRMFAAELKTNVLGKGYQLTISTVPPLGVGSMQAQINLRSGWTNPPNITITALANVQPAVMVIPSYITLAPGPVARAITNSVSVRNMSTNDLKITDAAVNVPGVSAEINEMQPGKAFTALVGFPEGFEVPPGRQVELTFKTSHPKYPLVKVPIMQMPRPARPPMPVAAPIKPPPTPVPEIPSIAPPSHAGQ